MLDLPNVFSGKPDQMLEIFNDNQYIEVPFKHGEGYKCVKDTAPDCSQNALPGNEVQAYMTSTYRIALLFVGIVFVQMILNPTVGTCADLSVTDQVNAYLKEIDSQMFMDFLIGPQGSPGGVEYAALSRIEIQYLIDHPDESIPLMVSRFEEMNDKLKLLLKMIGNDPTRLTEQVRQQFDASSPIHNPSTDIAYLIVFKHSKDPRAIEALVDYFDGLPAFAQASLENAGNAKGLGYIYAVSAACVFVDCSSLEKKYPGVRSIEGRQELVARLRAAAKLSSTVSH